MLHTSTFMQVQVLNDVAKTMPDEDWWIKSDACDVVAGLMESSRMVWAGDVDLRDGELQKQYKSYISYIQLVNRIVRDQNDTHHRSCTVMDLKSISSALVKDLSFITEGTISCVIHTCTILCVHVHLLMYAMR